MSYIPGQTNSRKPRRARSVRSATSGRRRHGEVVAGVALALGLVAAGITVFGLALSFAPEPKSSLPASDPATVSARLVLDTALGEARALNSQANPDAKATISLGSTIASCAELLTSSGASTAQLRGCELDVRTAAAAVELVRTD